MQFIKSLRTLFVFLLPLAAASQSSYLMPGSKDERLVERLEVKAGTNANLNFSSTKPYNRRLTVKEIEAIDSLSRTGDLSIKLSETDKYNIQRFLMNNSEWSQPRESYASKKPLKEFYKNQGNFYEVNTPDFFLAVNPVIQYQQSKESNNSQRLFYNSHGVSLRGMISKKVAFDVYITDNQERDPLYVQQFISSHKAVPGARFYKSFKAAGGVDYFDNRGSISINASKHIDIQLGYDKNFIGNGFRSLLLSDFSGSGTFLKINTRIWKLNYENLFMELIPVSPKAGGSSLLPRKYFRMNYLTLNATKWLNVGVFDAVMFGRKDHFDFQYLVPVLFLRPAESDIGSKDNAVLGLTIKANVKKTVQIYGQLLLDEFKLSEMKSNKGWWGNKYGYQLGIKYVDAFGINNLDVQVEDNRVRPFAYSHFDSVGNYTHYNKPFAHPLGASFQEFVGIARYQPLKKLYLQAKLIRYSQGIDTSAASLGSDPLKPYTTRPINPATGKLQEYGFYVGSGNKVTSLNLNFLASYEIRENMFIDANIQRRNYKMTIGSDKNTTVLSLGFRWNMARRDFDF